MTAGPEKFYFSHGPDPGDIGANLHPGCLPPKGGRTGRKGSDRYREEIKEAIETLFDIGIVIVTPTYSLMVRAIDLAKSLDVTCYDAVYLALAQELDFEFITADKKFWKSVAERKGQRLSVKLLANLDEGPAG